MTQPQVLIGLSTEDAEALLSLLSLSQQHGVARLHDQVADAIRRTRAYGLHFLIPDVEQRQYEREAVRDVGMVNRHVATLKGAVAVKINRVTLGHHFAIPALGRFHKQNPTVTLGHKAFTFLAHGTPVRIPMPERVVR